MDLGLSEAQQMLKNSAREFLEAECPDTFVRAMEEEERGYTSEMWQKIAEQGWHPRAIGGLTMGADPIVTAIARESLETDEVVNAFLVRKEPKDHGRQGCIVGIDDPLGLPVVIVDDVCPTGGSTILAIERAREAGMEVLGALCLVDREQGGRENIEDKIDCPFGALFTMKQLTG